MLQWFYFLCLLLGKIKNVLLWRDYKRSFYCTVIMVLTLTVLWKLPLRYLMILAIIKKIVTGKAKY